MRQSVEWSRKLPRVLLVAVTIATLVAAVGERGARADADAEARERCAVRLSVALRGIAPDAALFAAANPKDEVARLLATPEFVDRFAAFANSKLNDEPATPSAREPAYWLAREIIAKERPWADFFVGAYDVSIPEAGNSQSDPVVTANPDGLGYFRAEDWLARYAGNEIDGIKLATAYRIMNNVIGVELSPVTTAEGADVSSSGRSAAACRGCHFEGPFALDKVARTLTRVQRRGGLRFVPSPDPPQTILDGKTIANDKELVTALVTSQNFSFHACRLAFEYLYGRAEHTCEAAVFDACMASFESKKTMQSALRAVIADASFCQ